MDLRLKKLDGSIDKYLSEIQRIYNEDIIEAENTKTRLKDKLTKVKTEAESLELIEKEMLQMRDQQIALTDPDARVMSTSGQGTLTVGYNVLKIVDTENHLIVIQNGWINNVQNMHLIKSLGNFLRK
ncbi:MAG: hypothetical protein AB8B64_18990 [Granulosicoccus sp.]